jgi:N-acetylmuramoyl-L-alanine amidase
MNVYLSPSTQEHNIGAGDYGTEESRMNLVADEVAKLFNLNGISYCRNNPAMTLNQVIVDSNRVNPDVHLAVHSNAGGSGQARGTEVYCCKGSTRGKRLATCLYNYVSALTPVADRGVKEADNLGEVVRTTAPAAIVEVDFHDNPAGAHWIEANIRNIAIAIVKGVCEYLGKPFREAVEPTPPVQSGKTYKVQVGSFSVKSNADRMCNDLKSKGYEAYVIEV